VIFYELFAGMAAVSWALHGAVPPVRYKGGKRGYARQILARLDVPTDAEIVLVEADPFVAAALRIVWTPEEREGAAADFRAWAAPEDEQRARWTAWRDEAHAGGWAGLDWREVGRRWLWMRCRTVAMQAPPLCGRGCWLRRTHKANGNNEWALEAPARPVLALPATARATVIHGRAEDIAPHAGAVVYMDPPYDGTSGYSTGTAGYANAQRLAERWAAAGSVAAVSSPLPLRLDAQAVPKEGKGRTHGDKAEFLSVWAADRRKKKEQAA
jgi:hypothetical protein